MKNKLILMCGLASATKRHYEDVLVRTYDDVGIVNVEETRMALSYNNDDYWMHEKEVYNKCFIHAKKALNIHKMIIFDDEFLSTSEREFFFTNVAAAISEETEIYIIWIEPNIQTILNENSLKHPKAQQTIETIETKMSHRISPLESEPYNHIIFINEEEKLGIKNTEGQLKPIEQILAEL